MSASQDQIIASDGQAIAVESLAQEYSYNGDSSLAYIQVSHNGSNYRQSYTYTDGKLTNISRWVKQ